MSFSLKSFIYFRLNFFFLTGEYIFVRNQHDKLANEKCFMKFNKEQRKIKYGQKKTCWRNKDLRAFHLKVNIRIRQYRQYTTWYKTWIYELEISSLNAISLLFIQIAFKGNWKIPTSRIREFFFFIRDVNAESYCSYTGRY